MIRYTLYKVYPEMVTDKDTGLWTGKERYKVEEFEVLTNDTGEGIFVHDNNGGLKQLTGNAQFFGKGQKLRKWFDNDVLQERHFLSKSYAHKYAERMTKERGTKW